MVLLPLLQDHQFRDAGYGTRYGQLKLGVIIA
jgi:hypothetical protein